MEQDKRDYYRVLRTCQAQRPNEEITEWVIFFLESLIKVQLKLEEKMNKYGKESQLSPREKAILAYINDHPGCKSGEISKKLDIPSPTVKRLLTEMVSKDLIEKYGRGPGTNYSAK